MIRRVSLARCVASSTRRVQVVLHIDVEPGAAEPGAAGLRADLPEAILRSFADHAQRASDRSER